jgi:hypothetical protein
MPSCRLDRVVPVAVKAMRLEPDRRELGVRNVPALGVATGVELAAHAEPTGRAGRADQIHDHGQARQRLAPPGGPDVGEQPVFNLVPLARSRREVADREGETGAVGQPLQFPFPEADAWPVAAARVRHDEHAPCARIPGPPHVLPPSPDRPHGKRRGVMVNPHPDPPSVAREIVDPVRDRLAGLGNEEIMDAHPRGFAARPPFPPPVLEVPDHFLLLRVDGDDGLRCRLELADLIVDVPELCIPVGMGRALARLAIRLAGCSRPWPAVRSPIAG